MARSGREEVDDGGTAIHFLNEGTGEGSTLHFLIEGNGKRVPLFSFSMKEWTIGGPLFTFSMKEKSRDSAHHLVDEGKGDGFHSPLPQ